jgi:hypothetical protein
MVHQLFLFVLSGKLFTQFGFVHTKFFFVRDIHDTRRSASDIFQFHRPVTENKKSANKQFMNSSDTRLNQ